MFRRKIVELEILYRTMYETCITNFTKVIIARLKAVRMQKRLLEMDYSAPNTTTYSSFELHSICTRQRIFSSIFSCIKSCVSLLVYVHNRSNTRHIYGQNFSQKIDLPSAITRAKQIQIISKSQDICKKMFSID